jgi:hypothetical protein
MKDLKIRRVLAATALASVQMVLGATVQAEPFIDFGVSTGFFVRGCDINAQDGPDCLPGNNFPPFEVVETDLATLGNFASASSSTVRGNVGASVGFQGVSLTPAISAFVNSSATGRISSGGEGIQQYTAQQDGTLVLSGTLTYTTSGGLASPPDPQPTDDLSWGFIGAGFLVLESDTDRLDLANYGRFVNGQVIGSLRDIDQWDGVTEVASVFFDTPEGQTSGPVTASLSLDVQAGDVFFVLSFVQIIGRYGGFVNSTGTLISEFDQPSAVVPLSTEESFLPVQFEPVPGIDISPFSKKNKITPSPRVPIQVAILSTNTAEGEPVDLDALQVDPTSVRFGPDEASVIPWFVFAEDVDRDGDTDLILGFNSRETGIQCGDTEATLTGRTFGGAFTRGTDIIEKIPCHGH